jgi:hypothetical protein
VASQSTSNASAPTISTPVPSVTSASGSSNERSASMATTRRAVSARPRVSEPRPGPISTTDDEPVTPASATMRRIVLGSATKF